VRNKKKGVTQTKRKQASQASRGATQWGKVEEKNYQKHKKRKHMAKKEGRK